MDWFESASEYLAAWKARDAEWRKDFAPGALRTLTLARHEADLLNHNYIGTEHVLLGLTELSPDSPYNLLTKLGLNLAALRNEVKRNVGPGTIRNGTLSLPYTPRMQKVLKTTRGDAKEVGNCRVGPGHLFSGLLHESEGCTAVVFRNLALNREQMRHRVLEELRTARDSADQKQAESGT
jgi:ATP-dependent Clp protease ATP-binding subunit ClpC